MVCALNAESVLEAKQDVLQASKYFFAAPFCHKVLLKIGYECSFGFISLLISFH